jgi:hypothetical protein
MLEINEIKKELMKSKVMAKFSHYTSGNLYYTVELFGGIYQFPIETLEDTEIGELRLSSDLGTTSFYSEVKGSELSRWIDKANKKEEFIKIS